MGDPAADRDPVLHALGPLPPRRAPRGRRPARRWRYGPVRALCLVALLLLPTLLDPATYHEEDWIIRGVQRRIFVYRYGPYDIWGATGRIVQEFLARLESWPERPPTFAWTLDDIAAALAATA